MYFNSKIERVMKQETLEEAAIKYATETNGVIVNQRKKQQFIAGAKYQAERMLKFILDEDNHTEGELGNSCIDVQTLVHFIEQFKKK